MNSEKEVKIFKALGDPTRLRIIEMLSSGEKCVCKIIPDTGKSQPTVSAHLKVLHEAGLVKSCKEGISVYYCLTDEKIKELLKISKRINKRK
jgi:ArsR family transcriptional regulator